MTNEEYIKAPKHCIHCNNTIPYEKRNNIYCNRSCRTAHLNQGVCRNGSSHFCLQCGKHVDYRRKYCSNACQNAYQGRDYIDGILEKITNGKHIGQGTLRKYMKKTFEEKCMDPDCAWDHTKRPVVLEVDHIDGDANNNLPSNLRWLCPNCHSLTPTYKGKNKGNGRAKRRQRYAEGKSF